jgi:diacylglycerol kinase family enzyme
MAGAGVDARAVELVEWKHKKRVGYLAYVIAACKALGGPKAQIVVTDGRQSLAGEAVLIGNGRLYGGSFRVFPAADHTDGLLEVSLVRRATWWAVLRSGWGLLTRRLYTAGGVEHMRAETLNLFSALPVPFHVEGETVGHLPARFSVRRQALRVIVPG